MVVAVVEGNVDETSEVDDVLDVELVKFLSGISDVCDDDVDILDGLDTVMVDPVDTVLLVLDVREELAVDDTKDELDVEVEEDNNTVDDVDDDSFGSMVSVDEEICVLEEGIILELFNLFSFSIVVEIVFSGRLRLVGRSIIVKKNNKFTLIYNLLS